jgi:hypothetical protein
MIERLEIRKGAPSGCGKDFSKMNLIGESAVLSC